MSGGFLGYLPLAPGTFGAVLGVLVTYYCNFAIRFLLSVVLFVLGGILCQKAEAFFKKKDASHIVIDEVVGFMITMLWVPVTVQNLFCGFLLFRFFDVLKPYPIHVIDSHMKNGWGVMLDDVLAGVYGNIILQLVLKTQV